MLLVDLRRLALLLLLPAWLVLGPGWSLRFCAAGMLGERCCGPVAPACCPHEERAPRAPVAEADGACADCCIDVHTPAGEPAAAPQQLSHEIARAHLVAVEVRVESLAARPPAAAPSPPALAPGAPLGRSSPLPLRL
jgi:hypothetical protein